MAPPPPLHPDPCHLPAPSLPHHLCHPNYRYHVTVYPPIFSTVALHYQPRPFWPSQQQPASLPRLFQPCTYPEHCHTQNVLLLTAICFSLQLWHFVPSTM